jgi:hypothetical protein
MLDPLGSEGIKMSLIHVEAKKHRDLILKGNVLAIDPATGSSSKPGFAFFRNGKLVNSGVLDLDKKKDIFGRLGDLYDILYDQYNGVIDVLAIEKIRSSHNSLRWAEIVSIMAVRATVTIEVSPITWHQNVSKKYKKSDEQDSIEIGIALIKIAKKGKL